MKKKLDDTEVTFFKTTAVKAIREIFQLGNEKNCDDIIASAVHPVYKKLKFLTPEKKAKVVAKLEELCSQVSVDNNKTNIELSHKKIKTECDHSEAAMKYLMGEISDISDDENDDVESEVARYMAQPFKREYTLTWWKSNGHHYPYLEKLAKRFLCRPSTSVPSERLFSAAGNTVTKKRTRLDAETVDKLLFLHSYFKRKEQDHVSQLVKAEPTSESEAGTSRANELPSLPNLKQET